MRTIHVNKYNVFIIISKPLKKWPAKRPVHRSLGEDRSLGESWWRTLAHFELSIGKVYKKKCLFSSEMKIAIAEIFYGQNFTRQSIQQLILRSTINRFFKVSNFNNLYRVIIEALQVVEPCLSALITYGFREKNPSIANHSSIIGIIS